MKINQLHEHKPCSIIFLMLQMEQNSKNQSKHDTIFRVVVFCFKVVYGYCGRIIEEKEIVCLHGGGNGYVDEGWRFAVDVVV